MMNSRLELKSYLSKNFQLLQVLEFKKFLVLSQFSLEYTDFLKLQETCTDYVRVSSDKILICCNHSTLATNGRGDRQNKELELKSQIPADIPVYQIKRGGSLTLHHQGQWIFYPIIKLDADKWNLSFHLCWLIGVVKKVLKEFDLEVIGLRNPLGVWVHEKKIASIGIGVNRFISNHGLALNILSQPLSIEAFQTLNPCGLNSNIYSCVNNFLPRDISVEDFHEKFLEIISQNDQQDLHLLATAQECRFE